MEDFMWYYFGIINIVSAILFILDKRAAKKRLRRIPELTLHILEALGGVFSIFILMYILRHKYKKSKYYMWTWTIILWWIIIFLIFNNDFISWSYTIQKHR